MFRLLGLTLLLVLPTSFAHARSECVPSLDFTVKASEGRGLTGNRTLVVNEYGDFEVPTNAYSYPDPVNTDTGYDSRKNNESVSVGVTLSIPLGAGICDAYTSRERAKTRYDATLADRNEVQYLERMVSLCKENPEHPLLEGKCK